MEDSAPEESIFTASSNTADWGCATFIISYTTDTNSLCLREPFFPSKASTTAITWPCPRRGEAQHPGVITFTFGWGHSWLLCSLLLVVCCEHLVSHFNCCCFVFLFLKWQIWVYKKIYDGGKEERGAIDILHTKCFPNEHQTLYNRGQKQSINQRPHNRNLRHCIMLLQHPPKENTHKCLKGR